MTDQITDQRRREVAARLREGWSPFEATCTVLGRSETRGRWEGALADLVDRPTCRVEGACADHAWLSCGHDVRTDGAAPRYCPVCGAEVVGR